MKQKKVIRTLTTDLELWETARQAAKLKYPGMQRPLSKWIREAMREKLEAKS